MSDIETMKEKMENNLEAFQSRIRKLRTGRAGPELLSAVNVLYYGKQTPLSQMSSISVFSARTLVINPWDAKSLKEIEQALVRANLGAQPQNDGKVIRLNFPELTEDRRHELVKELKKQAEKTRIDIRNKRRETLEEIKKEVKNKEISEDEQKQLQSEIQKITDQFIENVDKSLSAKEKEIMEF